MFLLCPRWPHHRPLLRRGCCSRGGCGGGVPRGARGGSTGRPGGLFAASATGSRPPSTVQGSPGKGAGLPGDCRCAEPQGSKAIQSEASTFCLNCLSAGFSEGGRVMASRQGGQWLRGLGPCVTGTASPHGATAQLPAPLPGGRTWGGGRRQERNQGAGSSLHPGFQS